MTSLNSLIVNYATHENSFREVEEFVNNSKSISFRVDLPFQFPATAVIDLNFVEF